MCLTQHTVASLTKWNWDGDEIIHESIIPSSRPIVGTRETKQYDIDVREFLVRENNEVMKRTFLSDSRREFSSMPWPNWSWIELPQCVTSPSVNSGWSLSDEQ